MRALWCALSPCALHALGGTAHPGEVIHRRRCSVAKAAAGHRLCPQLHAGLHKTRARTGRQHIVILQAGRLKPV